MSCADFYNTSLTKDKKPLPRWAFGFTLSSEHIWSAFLVYCLLEDAMEQQEYLVVKHTGNQKDYFTKCVWACNECMHIEGQPELTHFCGKCTCWYYGPDSEGRDPSSLNTDRKCYKSHFCSSKQMFGCCHQWGLHWPPLLHGTQFPSPAE